MDSHALCVIKMTIARDSLPHRKIQDAFFSFWALPISIPIHTFLFVKR